MARKQNNTKTENKTVAEKPVKELSLKQMIENDHKDGIHFTNDALAECGYCQRAALRSEKKAEKRKAFYAAHPVYADN